MTSTSAPDPDHVPLWRRPARVLREHRRPYIIINVVVYGLFLVGFVLGLIFPQLHAAQATALEEDGTGELVRWLVNTPPLFALTIFGVNIRLSLLKILLPSLVIPFSGFLFFGWWTVETGMTLVQTTPAAWVAMIPHSLTLLIELQAYILLLLGTFILGKFWIFPQSAGEVLRRRSYVQGLRRIALLALPALVLLIIGAIWEAYSLRYLVYPLGQLLL